MDALNGAPGVHSARYAQLAGVPNPDKLSPDELNNSYLLQQLQGVAVERRTARYCCVLAAARDGQLLRARVTLPASASPARLLGRGALHGLILSAPRGTGGFGYDPLFWLPDRQQTMAEIPVQDKLPFSHRGRALADLLAHF